MKKVFSGIGIWIAIAMIVTFISQACWGTTAEGVIDCPDWYTSVFIVLLPITLSAVITKIIYKDSTSKAEFDRSTLSNYSNAKIPLTKKNRIKAANNLTSQVNFYSREMSESKTLSVFFHYWNKVIQTLILLTNYEGKVGLRPLPSIQIQTQTREYQWRIRDAIERSATAAIFDVTHDYRNNKTERYNNFHVDIMRYSSEFQQETVDFANEQIKTVARACKIQLPVLIGTNSDNSQYTPTTNSNTLDEVDRMEGHDFEYWCAELLEKNGYIDVEVTKGSGDQGVDVLATKDDIRYAIQCKCYMSDLGNTPVQEVHAGQSMYHCQVGVVMTNRHFTAGAKELAAATGVLLWDRDKLIAMLNQ